MNPVIRKIRREDVRGYYTALCEVASERRYLLTITPRPFAVMESFVKNNIDNDHAHYVADAGGTIVGWADIVPDGRETLTHCGMLGMALLPAWRGKGIGGQLLDAALDHAWRSGLKRVELVVFDDNLPARRLYEKHGFEVEGIKRYARFVDGRYQDFVLMAQYRI